MEEAGALRLGVSVAVAVDPLLRVTDALPVSVAEEAGMLWLGVSVAVAVDPLLRVIEALPVSVAEEVATTL